MNKKILIFIDWFLPGINSGGPVRSYFNMISHLEDEFDFYVITRNKDYCSNIIYDNIITNDWNVFSKNCKIFYLSDTKIKKIQYLKIVNDVSPDLIFINGVYSFYFSILPLLYFRNNNVIVSARGMLSSQAFTSKGFRKKIFLKFFSFLGIYNKITFHATNVKEKKSIIKKIGSKINIKIASNFPKKIDNDVRIRNKNDVTRFINLSRISIEKGTLRMLIAFVDVKFEAVIDIYGTIYNPEYWQKCQKLINKLPANITVNYKGVIPYEKISKSFQSYDYMISLSDGENYGHSIIESFSSGIPVIISNNTPWVNLQEKKLGWDLDLKNSNVSQVVNDACSLSSTEYISMSSNCYKFAKTICNSKQTKNENLQLLRI